MKAPRLPHMSTPCRGWLFAVLLAWAPLGVAFAQPVQLPSFNAPIKESSVSGFDAGAFMAAQFAMAWASEIRGVGMIGGGPFGCAVGLPPDAAASYGRADRRAAGPCQGGPPPFESSLAATAERMIDDGAIDPASFIRQQKIFVLRGANDTLLARAVADANVALWRHFLGRDRAGNLFYQTSVAAGHAMVTAQATAACANTAAPYLVDCGYDAAGVLLRHIYGSLAPANRVSLEGKLLSFSQAPFTLPFAPVAVGMAATGLVYVPAACAQGAACRVHIALHGCGQLADAYGSDFAEHAGYNQTADRNAIVVLYPQASASDGSGLTQANPGGCWDWWGLVTRGVDFPTKSGRQIMALHAMLAAATAGAKPAASPPATPGAVPTGLEVLDRSDTAVDLAWTAAPGAVTYRVLRDGPDGRNVSAGVVNGTSFADGGLAPGTTYRWRVTATVRGREGAPSELVSATTRPAPKPF